MLVYLMDGSAHTVYCGGYPALSEHILVMIRTLLYVWVHVNVIRNVQKRCTSL